MIRKPCKTPEHGPTGRNALPEGSLRRYSVGVLSADIARKRAYLETI